MGKQALDLAVRRFYPDIAGTPDLHIEVQADETVHILLVSSDFPVRSGSPAYSTLSLTYTASKHLP